MPGLPGLRISGNAVERHKIVKLFGGAITVEVPYRFQDLSDVLDVPDNQEMLLDSARDESITVEILEYVKDVKNDGSARWFLEDLATDQDTFLTGVTVNTNLHKNRMPYCGPDFPKSMAIGTMYVSKTKDGEEANNLVRCYVANVRIGPELNTDILITMWEPLHISPDSSSAPVLGAGPTVPAAVARICPAADVFERVLSTFFIADMDLFRS